MTPSDLIERYQHAQRKVKDAESQRAAVDAREQSFHEQLESYKTRLKEEGIDPAEIDEEILKIESQIDEKLTVVEEKLSGQQAQTGQDAPQADAAQATS